MALRIGQCQWPGVRCDVADDALADAQAGAMHGVGIEALGGVELQHLAGAQNIDRADLGHHLAGDEPHDLVEPFLRGTGTRHHIPEPPEY
jgi:hypothetical protein